MATLPAHPDLDQLRTQARELQRSRACPLHVAQRELAQDYGFPSWPRLVHHVEALHARTWLLQPPAEDLGLAEQFVRLACLTYGDDDPSKAVAAAALLREHPEIPSLSLAAAAAAASPEDVRRQLGGSLGPYGWPALMYLTYSRVEAPVEAVLACLSVLLEAGADPNDGRFFLGLPVPFTVLTGVFGGGEQNPPPHPHALTLGRALLRAGAEPNDGQTLYNRMFSDDDDAFRLLFAHGLGKGDGGPWRRLLPESLPEPQGLLHNLLAWAILHNQRDRIELLAAQGLDLSVPLASGVSPAASALRNGHRDLARRLVELGASEADLSEVDRFIGDLLEGDAVASDLRVSQAIRARPGLVVWATSLQRPGAVELLVSLGFDVNAFARADLPREQPWQTALHTAVERRDPVLVQRLLELGADPSLRDTRFDGTPRDWAEHLGFPELLTLLGG